MPMLYYAPAPLLAEMLAIMPKRHLEHHYQTFALCLLQGMLMG